MAQQIINVGASANDGTGDTLRGAFIKTDDNFDELYTGKENTITAGTTSQYYRGDKTFQTLNKSAVGLGNVDNTSDLNKPVSTATQTALNAKIGGSGTDNYVSKFTASGSIGNSLIFDNGSSVGIGTTSPQAKLHSNSDILTGYFQNGTNGIYDALKITNNTASNNLSGNSARIQFYNNANNSTNLLGASIRSVNVDYGWASDLILSSVQNNGYASQTVNDAIWIKSNGNVGIGTTTPATKLDIVSTTNDGFDSIIVRPTNLTQTLSIGWQGISASLNYIVNAGASERMRITSSGNVNINTTTGDGRVNVNFNANSESGIAYKETSGIANGAYCVFKNESGTEIGTIKRISTTNAVAYNTTSDYRLKEDLKPIKGLELISKIKVYDFKWKEHNDRMDGVIAHELQEIIPYAVTGEKDAEKMQQVDYSKLVPILVQAIQEQQTQIEELKTLINK